MISIVDLTQESHLALRIALVEMDGQVIHPTPVTVTKEVVQPWPDVLLTGRRSAQGGRRTDQGTVTRSPLDGRPVASRFFSSQVGLWQGKDGG